MTFCPPHSYEVVTPPEREPVDVSEAKAAARVDTDEDDSVIEQYIREAREAVEIDASMCLMTQTLRLNLDWLPSLIEVRRYPIQSLTFAYTDTSGNSQTLSASDYITDFTSFPPRIVPAYGVAWPTVREQPKAVRITFVAGYTSALLVPPSAKQAILLSVAKRIREREGLGEEDYQRAYDSCVNRLRRFNMV